MSSHFQFDIAGAAPIAVNVPDKATLMDHVRANPGQRRDLPASGGLSGDRTEMACTDTQAPC